MCGRVMCKLDPKLLQRLLRIRRMLNMENYRSSYNLGPTSSLPVISQSSENPVASPNLSQQSQTPQSPHEQEEERKILKTAPKIQEKPKKEATRKLIKKSKQESNLKKEKAEIALFPESKKTESEFKAKHQIEENKTLILEEEIKIHDYQKTKKEVEGEIEEDKEVEKDCELELDLEAVQWGFKMRNKSNLVINGRLEELHRKNMFKKLLSLNRCVVIVGGYYEWARNLHDSTLKPYFIHTNDSQVMYLAGICFFSCNFFIMIIGLFNYEEDKEGNMKKKVVILTSEAYGAIEFIHHRKPVVLSQENMEFWLNRENSFEDCVKKIYKKGIVDTLGFHEVSSYVNAVKHDGEQCITPASEIKPDTKGIEHYFKKQQPKEPKSIIPKNISQTQKLKEATQTDKSPKKQTKRQKSALKPSTTTYKKAEKEEESKIIKIVPSYTQPKMHENTIISLPKERKPSLLPFQLKQQKEERENTGKHSQRSRTRKISTLHKYQSDSSQHNEHKELKEHKEHKEYNEQKDINIQDISQTHKRRKTKHSTNK